MFKKIFAVLVLIVAVFLIQNTASARWHIGGKAQKLKKEQSVFVPMNNVSENRVWVGTFQLVWNYLQDEIVKAPVKFVGVKSKLADDLNKQGFRKEMLSEKSYYLKSGKTTLSLKKEIEKGIHDKFNETSDILDSVDWSNEEAILIYAMLKKDFQFLKEFQIIENQTFMDEPVKFFGIRKDGPKELRDNVKVLFYNNENDYAVKLLTKSNDEVILYRTDDDKSFEKYYSDLNTKISNNSSSTTFLSDDSMKVPFIKFDDTFKYKELTNKPIYKTDFFIGDAIQTIKFKMDNKGVVLKSEAAIIAKMSFMPMEEEKTREFNFDKPFVLFLNEKGKKTPYFIAQFNNAKLFEKP